MRKELIVAILIGMIFVVGCSPTQTSDLPANAKQVTLEIEGMYCQSCSQGVGYELRQVEGVMDAQVDYQTGEGVVTYDPSKVNPETIAAASTVYKAKVKN